MKASLVNTRVFMPSRASTRRASAMRIVAYKDEPTDMGKYLSSAFVQIFKPTHTAKDLKFVVTPFAGRIAHSDKARLGTLYTIIHDVVDRARKQGFQYGAAAEAVAAARESAKGDESVQAYLEGAISNVFGHNFTGDATEPQWMVQPFSGKIMSQKDIVSRIDTVHMSSKNYRFNQQLVDELLAFERVIKHAMNHADEAFRAENESRRGLRRDM